MVKKLQASWELRTDGKTISDDLKNFRNEAITAENFLDFLESGMTISEWQSQYIREKIWGHLPVG